jgi:hypothetical protein
MSTLHTPAPDLPPEDNPSRHPACHATSTASAATTGRPTSRTLSPRSASLLAALACGTSRSPRRRFRPKSIAPELVRNPKMSDSAEAVNGVPEPAPRVTPLREPLPRPPLAAAPPVPEPEISAPAAQGPTADELL